MYDRADFIPRPVVGGHCTWDESFYEACLPYVKTAQRYFECGSGDFSLGNDLSVTPLVENFRSNIVSDRLLERWSLPTRFGSLYGPEMERLSNLHVLTGARTYSLSKPGPDGRIDAIGIENVFSGEQVTIRAKTFVIAAGAQETTRLLLANPDVFANRGGTPPSLGRYYQGHISGKIASICFKGKPERTEFGFRREADGSYQRRRFQFMDEAVVKNNLTNIAFWLDNPLYFDPAHRSGAMSFMYLAMLTPILGRRLAPPAVAYSITKGRVNRVGAHLSNIMKGLPGSLWTPFSIFIRRYLFRRKLPGVFLYSAENRYALHFHAEQIPWEDNRMKLNATGDKLVIDYEITDIDADAVIRAHELLDAELRRCGAGELAYWYPPADRQAAIKRTSKDGVHQSGTTRISPEPQSGVVDRDLRVWGTDNLYLCSSSVFPTSGQANPTFFMGVCALRLVDTIIKNAHR